MFSQKKKNERINKFQRDSLSHSHFRVWRFSLHLILFLPFCFLFNGENPMNKKQQKYSIFLFPISGFLLFNRNDFSSLYIQNLNHHEIHFNGKNSRKFYILCRIYILLISISIYTYGFYSLLASDL